MHVCACVCLCVCMYVYMYVCMYVCVGVCVCVRVCADAPRPVFLRRCPSQSQSLCLNRSLANSSLTLKYGSSARRGDAFDDAIFFALADSRGIMPSMTPWASGDTRIRPSLCWSSYTRIPYYIIVDIVKRLTKHTSPCSSDPASKTVRHTFRP